MRMWATSYAYLMSDWCVLLCIITSRWLWLFLLIPEHNQIIPDSGLLLMQLGYLLKGTGTWTHIYEWQLRRRPSHPRNTPWLPRVSDVIAVQVQSAIVVMHSSWHQIKLKDLCRDYTCLRTTAWLRLYLLRNDRVTQFGAVASASRGSREIASPLLRHHTRLFDY